MHENQLPFFACTQFLETAAHSGAVEKLEK